MDYILEVTEEQLEIINKSLELYARLHIGQPEDVADIAMNRACHDYHDDVEKRNLAINKIVGVKEQLRGQIKKDLYGVEGGYYSISDHQKVPDCARIAYDLYQIIRHRLAWDKHIETGGDPTVRPSIQVFYDEPFLISQTKPAKVHKNGN